MEPTKRPHTYTGVGSRKTTPKNLSIMRQIAQALAARNYRLRTGDAEGADSAFTSGALSKLKPQQVQELIHAYVAHDATKRLASYERKPDPDMIGNLLKIVGKYHPNPAALKTDAYSRGSSLGLQARNALQLGGDRLTDPSDFAVMAFTPPNQRRFEGDLGGTGQAFRLAKAKNIPVFDLDAPEATMLSELGKYKGPDNKTLERMLEFILRNR
jgi:hypothetical protein